MLVALQDSSCLKFVRDVMMTSSSVPDVKCTIYLIRIAPLPSCLIWELLISPVEAPQYSIIHKD